MKRCIEQLIYQLKEVQKGNPWIGSSYKKKLEVLSDEDFFRRPLKDVHSVAELISHLTIWRKETALKIKTGRGSITDSDPSNWREIGLLRGIGRQRILKDYDDSLQEIIELLSDKQDEFLEKKYYDNDFRGDYTYSWLLNGMLHHDLYHLGQIGYIVKFLQKPE